MATPIIVNDFLKKALSKAKPFYSFTIGERTFDCWEIDLLPQQFKLLNMKVQLERLKVGNEYQHIYDRVQELGQLAKENKLGANDVIERDSQAEALTKKQQELLDINIKYIEALTKQNEGTFYPFLKSEFEIFKKENKLPEDLPIDTVVNQLMEEINKFLEPEATEDNNEKKEQTEAIEVKALPQA